MSADHTIAPLGAEHFKAILEAVKAAVAERLWAPALAAQEHVSARCGATRSSTVTVAPTVATIPLPATLKAELIQLYQTVRLTRALLKLSERVHANFKPANMDSEVGNAGR